MKKPQQFLYSLLIYINLSLNFTQVIIPISYVGYRIRNFELCSVSPLSVRLCAGSYILELDSQKSKKNEVLKVKILLI